MKCSLSFKIYISSCYVVLGEINALWEIVHLSITINTSKHTRWVLVELCGLLSDAKSRSV